MLVLYDSTSRQGGRLKAVNVLSIITEIYLEKDCESYLQDFAMLHWAYNDLAYSEQQWYWHGATRENIDAIIRQYFLDWKAKCG